MKRRQTQTKPAPSTLNPTLQEGLLYVCIRTVKSVLLNRGWGTGWASGWRQVLSPQQGTVGVFNCCLMVFKTGLCMWISCVWLMGSRHSPLCALGLLCLQGSEAIRYRGLTWTRGAVCQDRKNTLGLRTRTEGFGTTDRSAV